MRKDVKWPKRLTAVESRNETNFSIMTYFVVPLCHGCENWDCPVGTPGSCDYLLRQHGPILQQTVYRGGR